MGIDDNTAAVVKALERIADELKLIRVELSEMKELLSEVKQSEQRKPEPKSKKSQKNEGKTKWTTEDVYNYIKENCPKTFKFLQSIKQMPSGDFLIKLDYMTRREYDEVKNELKEQLEAEYWKKYQGFIVKASRLR